MPDAKKYRATCLEGVITISAPDHPQFVLRESDGEQLVAEWVFRAIGLKSEQVKFLNEDGSEIPQPEE